MRVALTHATRLDYSRDVVEGVLDTRLGPRSGTQQRWDRFELTVDPMASVRRYEDAFGNAAHLITVVRPHRHLEMVTRSEVNTLLADPFEMPARPPRPLGTSDLADYLGPSRLVASSLELERIAARFRPGGPDAAFESVRQLMGFIYSEFVYQQHVTSVATTVAEVLACRTGVCQDFAHVLLGLCRSVGIPARYVSGYIVQAETRQSQAPGEMVQVQRTDQAPERGVLRQAQDERRAKGVQRADQAPERGVGASHAWVEAFIPTHGWRGFDPTNNLVASEYHVKMAIGRDYSDVPPTRGTARGGAEESLTVVVDTRILE